MASLGNCLLIVTVSCQILVVVVVVVVVHCQGKTITYQVTSGRDILQLFLSVFRC